MPASDKIKNSNIPPVDAREGRDVEKALDVTTVRNSVAGNFRLPTGQEIHHELCRWDVKNGIQQEVELGCAPGIVSLTLASTTTLVPSIQDVDLPVGKDGITRLPQKSGSRSFRFIRWTFFSVYRRLFTIVFLANAIAFIILLAKSGHRHSQVSSQSVATAASANLLAAIVVRNEHVVNMLFLLAVSLPRRNTLFIRRICGKVYSYGGVHSGCGVAAVVWYLLFSALLTRDFVRGALRNPALLALTYTILALLLSIVIFAHPRIRSSLHDHFEAVHRFAGWTAVGLFWAQTIVLADTARSGTHKTLGQALLVAPAFWFVIIITCCIAYPWARLRSRKVRAEPLSDHAIRLHFDYTTLKTCMGVRLSDNPLKETHAFAGIPNADGSAGFSVVISNAGDWTKHIIRNPPTRLWSRGAPVYGVLRIATLFDPVLIVTTGSGIGPCLSLFHGRPGLRCRILWSTPSPEVTYGKGIIDSVLKADSNAMIIDTRKAGRPDILAMTYQLYEEVGAEAVVVISNPKVTRKVVYGMESRKIPAFGAIWDS